MKDRDGKVLCLIPEGHIITDRKLAEERLAGEHRRITSILEGTNAGTWEMNVQTGEIVLNSRWVQMLGYTLEDLAPISTQTVIDLIHPDDVGLSAELLRKHLEGELPYYDLECRMRRKEGGWIWINARGRLMTRDAAGEPLLMFGTQQDITERKQQEEKLQESERRFHAIIDASPVPLVLEDDEANLVYLNPAFTEFYGYTLEDVPTLDDWWPKAFPDPVYREEIKRQWKERVELVRSGHSSPPPQEGRIRCKDGSFCTALASLTMLSGYARSMKLIVLYDVTLIKSMTERLQTLLANASDGIHVLDVQGNVVEFSESFARMLGYTLEEAAELNVRDWDAYFPSEDILLYVEKYMTSSATFETRHRRKDGEEFDVGDQRQGDCP